MNGGHAGELDLTQVERLQFRGVDVEVLERLHDDFALTRRTEAVLGEQRADGIGTEGDEAFAGPKGFVTMVGGQCLDQCGGLLGTPSVAGKREHGAAHARVAVVDSLDRGERAFADGGAVMSRDFE